MPYKIILISLLIANSCFAPTAFANQSSWLTYTPTTLKSLQTGKDATLKYSDRLTLVYFTASWCDICNQSTQIVRYLHKQYAHLGLKTVLVYLHESFEDAKKDFLYKELGVDAYLGNDAMIRKFYNPIAPTIFLIDSKGYLTAQYTKDSQLNELTRLVMLTMSY